MRIGAALVLVVALAALSGCGQSPSSSPPAATATPPAGSASPAPASFVGMWWNADRQVLFVAKAPSCYVGTFYEGGVKELQSDLREHGGALVGRGTPGDGWTISRPLKISYDSARERLVVSNPKWASMSFTKAPPNAAGLSGGSAAQADPVVGTWQGLGQAPAGSQGSVMIARTPDGYRVSEVVGGELLGTSYLFFRNGDEIQDFRPAAPKPEGTIRWVFRYKGHLGQLVMGYGNGLPHLLVRTSMSTTLPSPSPTP